MRQTIQQLSVGDAADYLGVSKSFLDKARLSGKGPIFVKYGTNVAYLRADLDHWVNLRRRASTSQTKPFKEADFIEIDTVVTSRASEKRQSDA